MTFILGQIALSFALTVGVIIGYLIGWIRGYHYGYNASLKRIAKFQKLFRIRVKRNDYL